VTEISFHTGVGDPLDYACRLVRKAYRKGSQVVVSAAPETLRRLDVALWSFDPLDFVPHAVLGNGAPERLAPTPVWLVAPGLASPTHDVLVNLGAGLAPGFETWQRVIEIVGDDATSAEAARARWRHYKERGYAVSHHEAAGRG